MTKSRLAEIFNIPPEIVWMLAVDGRFWVKENGPEGFEKREKNSVAGILKGLAVALADIDKELTVEHILATHKACMKEVKSENPSEPGQYRKVGVFHFLRPETITLAGLSYLLSHPVGDGYVLYADKALVNYKVVNGKVVGGEPKKLKECKAEEKIKFLTNLNDKLTSKNMAQFPNLMDDLSKVYLAISYVPPDHKLIPVLMRAAVEKYNEDIKAAITQGEKLLVIADTIQTLIRIHFGSDGNNRTAINCILSRLLVQHFGQFSLFFDPNLFEMHAPIELVGVIEQSLEAAQTMRLKPLKPIFGFDRFKDVKADFVALGHRFLKDVEDLVKESKEIERSHNYFQQVRSVLANEFVLFAPNWKQPLSEHATKNLQRVEEENDFPVKLYQAY